MSFNTLTEDQKRLFAGNCVKRRLAYETWWKQGRIGEEKDILLIADRPGPGAPQTDDYHHTPFYAKTASGGWVNALLVKHEIPETRLFWENSADRHGEEMPDTILHLHEWKHVFALGNNAAAWLTKNGVTNFCKVLHPQAHKRFASKTPYELIQQLQILHRLPLWT
jgi:hypothetical protein